MRRRSNQRARLIVSTGLLPSVAQTHARLPRGTLSLSRHFVIMPMKPTQWQSAMTTSSVTSSADAFRYYLSPHLPPHAMDNRVIYSVEEIVD